MLGMALAAAGLLTHGLTAAQEKSLETVVVTASGFEQEIKDAPADPELAVREQEVDLVLRIPDTYAEAWRKGEPAQVELVFDQSQRDASSSVTRLRGMLDAYGQRTAVMRVVARGLSPTMTRPPVVANRDQSTAQARGVRAEPQA